MHIPIKNYRRVVLSDGMYFIHGVLLPKHSQMVETGKIRKLCLLKVENFFCRAVNSHKFCFLFFFFARFILNVKICLHHKKNRICVVVECEVRNYMSIQIGQPKAYSVSVGRELSVQLSQNLVCFICIFLL